MKRSRSIRDLVQKWRLLAAQLLLVLAELIENCDFCP
jgi:hypothetical protein